MPKFYMTFGSGQPNGGHVLPLIADSELQARLYMRDTFDSRWCGTYTPEYWENWKQTKPPYIPLEREMLTKDIRGYVPADRKKEVE